MDRMDMARRDMRDRARRDRQSRDGRNPYGSRGGYVRDSRSQRSMEDMARGYDMAMEDMARQDRQRQEDMARGYDKAMRDMARGGGRDRADREDFDFDFAMDMNYTPFEVKGNIRNPFRKDMNDFDSGEKLEEEDLKKWYEKLMKEVPDQYRHLYKKESIEKVAKQMQIEFDKFEPMELVVTTVMIATDYPKSVGYADVNRNVAMAKEWLCDEDSKLKYGQKLSAYYDEVVNG